VPQAQVGQDAGEEVVSAHGCLAGMRVGNYLSLS
jgi:hypothetical protein